MCTLIALHRCVAGAPLVVAANRDEFLDRPAEGPALRETSHGSILAPRDVRAGGTWLGINSSGLFAAVTNRRTDKIDPARRSRGLLVMDVLSTPTAEEAAGRIERLPRDVYNPFNLLVADGRTAHLFSHSGTLERFDLEVGVHVIGNVHPEEGSQKVVRIAQQAKEAAAGPAATVLDRLSQVCRSHEGRDSLEATCVHAGEFGTGESGTGEYGTRSSTLLRFGADPELRFADGAPCTQSYDEYTPLLRDLAPGAEGRLDA